MDIQIFTERRFEHTRLFELGLIIALSLCIVILQGNKRFLRDSRTFFENPGPIPLTETPQTLVEKKTVPPQRPSIPIPAEKETDLLELDIPDIREWDKISEMPPIWRSVEPEESFFFEVVETRPEPIGGYPAILKYLVYPEIARISGIEGRVIVMAYIDETGQVVKTEILKSLGPNGCDEAAEAAVRAIRWKPALQRDRPVKVKISIPIDFRLARR